MYYYQLIKNYIPNLFKLQINLNSPIFLHLVQTPYICNSSLILTYEERWRDRPFETLATSVFGIGAKSDSPRE